MKTKFNLFIALTLSFFYSFSQNGTVKGIILDGDKNDPVFGVTVTVEKNNTTDPNLATVVTGTMSDLDGKFTIMVPPGVYNIRFRNMSYQNLLIENVDVKAKDVKVLDEIRLQSSTTKLDEIVISVNKIQNTEESVLQDKKNSTNLKDGISAAAFKKVGDSDAASSMKRVTGVSVQDGKYVYVRGLGDRYNKTILNGMDIPGLDPDKNSLQMDIFPTSLIDNITVHKSFSAELPADFSGGVIDISTKEFPDKKEGTLSLSTAYNPIFHFNPEYLTYQGGSTDFLGFDDGTRKIPATANFPLQANAIVNPATDGVRYNTILTSFNPTMAAMQQNSLMDFSLGATYGNQKAKEKYTIGYSIGADYKNNTTFYKDAIFARYGMFAEADRTELDLREYQKGSYGENSVLLSTFGGLSLKTKQSKYNLKALHLQNGESKAGIFDYESNNQGANFYGFQHNLEYSQKQLTNILLSGKHNFEDKKLDVDWKVAGTLSVMDDPDVRFTRYQIRGENIYDMSSESGFPQRIWRNMNEKNISSVLHFTKKLTIKERDAKFKYGGAFTYKDRDFLIQSFSVELKNPNRTNLLTGDPNEIFLSNNLWSTNDLSNPDPNSLQTIYSPDFIPVNPNQFTANSVYGAAYTSIEMEYFKNLKSVIGLRVEQFQQKYTGRDLAGANILNNQKVLDDFDFFPTINLVYAVNDTQNIRLSYSKTIARPSMKEMSFAQILDPLTGRSFSGGMFRDANDLAGVEYWNGKLISSDIHNLDARWELFQNKGQIFSVSSFYKRFINPIEIVQFAQKANAFQPRNVGNGDLLGIELEMRKNLSFLTSKLQKISINLNYTLTQSRIEMSKTERDSRVENAREGQEIGKYRDMAGQSPYLINAGLSYDGGEKGFLKKLQFGLYYNVQGPTLTFVGMVDRPDVYTVPFHSLNFNGNKVFGKNENMTLGLKVSNLLLDKKELVFDSFGAKDEYFTQLNLGILTKLSFSMKF